METSTASRLLSIRLFVKIYGPWLPSKLWQCTASQRKLSALLSVLSNLVPPTKPVSIVLFSNLFFSNSSHVHAHPVQRTYPGAILHSAWLFQSLKSSTDLVSHHLLPQIVPYFLSYHPSFTVNSALHPSASTLCFLFPLFVVILFA